MNAPAQNSNELRLRRCGLHLKHALQLSLLEHRLHARDNPRRQRDRGAREQREQTRVVVARNAARDAE